MRAWDLPTSAELGGQRYPFRSDFRDVLDVVSAMTDQSVPEDERGVAVLAAFYDDAESIPMELWQEALDYAAWFVNGGEKPLPSRRAKVMDWEQDADLIAAPVNRILGYECRTCSYLHWWSFLAAYMEIGDCMFAQVVAIRDKQGRGKRLEKHEREFYARNRDIVDLRRRPSAQDEAIIEEWIGG